MVLSCWINHGSTVAGSLQGPSVLLASTGKHGASFRLFTGTGQGSICYQLCINEWPENSICGVEEWEAQTDVFHLLFICCLLSWCSFWGSPSIWKKVTSCSRTWWRQQRTRTRWSRSGKLGNGFVNTDCRELVPIILHCMQLRLCVNKNIMQMSCVLSDILWCIWRFALKTSVLRSYIVIRIFYFCMLLNLDKSVRI